MWYANRPHSAGVRGSMTNAGSRRSTTSTIVRDGSSTRRSPARRTLPRGSDVPNSSPLSERRRPRALSRSSHPSAIVSRAYSRADAGRVSSRYAASATGRVLNISKQKVPLRQRQDVSRVAPQQLAVGPHLVRVGIDVDLRQRIVHHEILLAERATAVHGRQRPRQAGEAPAGHARLADEVHAGRLERAAEGAEHPARDD